MAPIANPSARGHELGRKNATVVGNKATSHVLTTAARIQASGRTRQAYRSGRRGTRARSHGRSHDLRHMRTTRDVAIVSAMHDFLLAPHIIAGVVALASMIVPLVAPKGGRVHRSVGWVFVIAMTGVSATAFALAIRRFTLADAQHPNAHAIGLFLFYVATLTAAGVSSGVRALRFQARSAASRGVGHRDSRGQRRDGGHAGVRRAQSAHAVHRVLARGLDDRHRSAPLLATNARTPPLVVRAHGHARSCVAALTALVVVNAARFDALFTFSTDLDRHPRPRHSGDLRLDGVLPSPYTRHRRAALTARGGLGIGWGTQPTRGQPCSQALRVFVCAVRENRTPDLRTRTLNLGRKSP